HAPAWACVGSANAPSNHALVAGENPSSKSDGMLPYCLAPLTFPQHLAPSVTSVASRPGPAGAVVSAALGSPDRTWRSGGMKLSRQAPPTARLAVLAPPRRMRSRLVRPSAVLVGAAIASTVLTGCGASSSAPASSSPPATASAAMTGAPPSATTPAQPPAPARSATPQASPTAALPVAPGAGSQPQTQVRPRTDTPAFRNALADLWLAVTTGN